MLVFFFWMKGFGELIDTLFFLEFILDFKNAV